MAVEEECFEGLSSNLSVLSLFMVSFSRRKGVAAVALVFVTVNVLRA